VKKRTTKPRMPRRRQTRPAETNEQSPRAAKPSFAVEALEPRILLSGTWVDTATGNSIPGATEGNDTFQASTQGDLADGLGGDDILRGEQGQDTLSGGAGNDQLFGGVGIDTLDGGAGNDQLFGEQGSDVLVSGGGNDTMDGGAGSDTFQVTGAQHGDVITVEGGSGDDTIDLSQHAANNVTNNGSTITVNLGGGQSFTINQTGVESVVTGAAVNNAPTAGAGSLTINEDASASAVTLSGTDPDAGDAVTSYRIESLPTNGTLRLNGVDVHANDLVTQTQIDGGQLAFQPNADWNGSTSFTYKAHDGDAFSDNTGTFSVTVNPAAQAQVPAPPPAPPPSLPPSAPVPSVPVSEPVVPSDPVGTVVEAPGESVIDQPVVDVISPDADSEIPATEDPGAVVVIPPSEPVGAPVDSNAPATDGPNADAETNVVPVMDDSTTTGQNDSSAGDMHWDGHENLGVLDPMSDVSGSVEVSPQNADAFEELDAVETAVGAEAHFDVSQLVTFPADPFAGLPAANALPDAPPGSTAADLYVEVGTAAGSLLMPARTPSDAMLFMPAASADANSGTHGELVEDADLRHRPGRFVEESSFELPASARTAHDDAPVVADADSVPLAGPVSSGFFAGLWAALRGMGTKNESSEPTVSSGERSAKRR